MQKPSLIRSPRTTRGLHTIFYAGLAALVVIAIATAVVTLMQLHQQAEKRAVSNSQNLAKSLVLSFGGLIDTINMALLSSSNEIAHQVAEGAPSIAVINRMLSEQQQHIGHIPYIRATNEDGDVIYGADLTRPFNISERDYFVHLRDNPSSDLYASQPIVSMFSGKWIWVFARRINKPDGSFGGVIYAPIPINEIQRVFAAMDVETGNSIALREAGQGLIARHAPGVMKEFAPGDKTLSDDFVHALGLNSQSGMYTSGTSSIDGMVRMHAYHRHAKYGFTVNVGLSRDAIFAEWRKQAWVVGGFVAAFVLALLFFSWAIRQSLKRQESVIDRLLEAQKIALLGQYIYDLRTGTWTSSEVLDELFGIDNDYPRDTQGWLGLVAPDLRIEMQAYLESLIAYNLPFDQSYRILRPCDGQERWVHGKGEWQLDNKGRPRILFGTIQDITRSKEHEAELQKVANHDMLTGLPNRRLLTDRLYQAVSQANRQGTYLAVCYFDLDDFKAINDRFGHEVGDKFLIAVSKSLQQAVRNEDMLARIGGDEFVLLLVDVLRTEDIYAALDRVLEALHAKVQVNGITLQLSASIGVALFPDDDVDADTLLRHADQAMYRAKETGKNRYQLFDPEHERQMQSNRNFQSRLVEALSNEEFVLHYQPKVDLLNGAVVGAEALIRWAHPEKGLLPPAAFLQYLDSNLAINIGEWVIESALAQMQAWKSLGLDLAVSVNISANHLLSPEFTENLRQILGCYPGILPSMLELEILETAALSDMEQAVRTLNVCREYGVRVALDDFGTGYSSLTYFRKLPIDILKIDRSFVQDMLDSDDDLELVGNVVQLAHVFNRPVIAEGVETLKHGEMLLALGCRMAQGYGIARPMPAEQMAAWVNEWNHKAVWLEFNNQQVKSHRNSASKAA